MLDTDARPVAPQSAIREVRTTDVPAVQHLVASAVALADTVDRLAREHAWN